MKEARMKSLMDFHKTHPSGSGTVAENPPSVKKITPTVISKGSGDKPGVPDVTNDDSSKSESESWGNDEDDNEESDDDDQEEEEFDQENKYEDDEMKSDEEQGIDDTTYQFDDYADARLEELTKTATRIVQDAHVTISTIPKKTEVPVTSSSRSSDLASKFQIFLDIPQTDAKIVSPLDVHVHHEVPRTQAPTLLTIPVLVIPESSPRRPKSNNTHTHTHTHTAGSDRGLKKRKTSKDTEPTTGLKKKDSTSRSSKGTKSQPKSTGKSVQSEELVFEVADLDMPQDLRRANLG
ncbi:hypothetical protein Tco_1532500 [Tanacetum coccineum]